MAERIEADLTLDSSDYNKGLKSADKKTEEFGKKTGSRFGALAGGAIAGVGVAAAAAGVAAAGALGKAAFDVSRQTSEGSKALAAELGALSMGAERYAEAARAAWRNNFGEDVQASFAKIKDLSLSLGRDLDPSELQSMTEAAFTLEEAFGADTAQFGQAIGVLKNMGLTGQQAIDFLTDGFQRGHDASGDYLETLNEYGSVFADVGADAGELFSIFETGQGTGVLGTDKIADMLKEFQIRIREVSSDSLSANLGKFGLDKVKEMVDAGEMDVIDAFQSTLKTIQSLDSEADKFNLAQQLFGTQSEDVGVGTLAELSITDTSLEGTLEQQAGSMDLLQDRYDTLGGSASSVWRSMLDSLTPVTDKLLELAQEWMPKISDWFEGPGKAGMQTFIDKAGEIWSWIEEFILPLFADLWESLKEGAKWFDENSKFIENMKAGLSKMWAFIKDFFAEFKRLFEERDWAGLGKHVITSIIEFAALQATVMIGNVVAIGQDIWDAIKNIDWRGLGKAIIDGIVAGWNWYKDVIKDAILGAFTIGGINILEQFGGLFGGKKRVVGGDFTSAVDKANEHFIGGGSEAAGNSYNVTINAPNGDGASIAREFDRRLDPHGVDAARRQRGQYAYGY